MYRPIELAELEPGHVHGHSGVLNLDLCSHQRRLRWYDPVEQRYLMTYAEEREARFAEREARIAAEARAHSAEARVQELEEELRRRRES